MEYVLYGLKIKLTNAFMDNIKEKDIEIYRHSLRVMNYATKFGIHCNFKKQDIEVLKYSSMLHDIGKLGLPLFIRRKTKKVPDEDIIRARQSHCRIGYEMLNTVSCFDEEIDIIYHHHERVDGLGYPDGLKGYEISNLCKIVSVCNYFDTIANEKNMGEETAIEQLMYCKGTKFDAQIIDKFIEWIQSKQLLQQSCCL